MHWFEQWYVWHFCFLFLTSFRLWTCICLLHFFVILSDQVEFLVWHLGALSRCNKPHLFRIFSVLQIILLIAKTRNFGFVKSLTTIFGKLWLQTRKKKFQKSISGVNAKKWKWHISAILKQVFSEYRGCPHLNKSKTKLKLKQIRHFLRFAKNQCNMCEADYEDKSRCNMTCPKIDSMER